MSALGRLLIVAGVLLRATADAIDAFSKSVTGSTVPDTVPEWMNEEADL